MMLNFDDFCRLCLPFSNTQHRSVKCVSVREWFC